jgi:hypothetical protein
MSLDFKCIYSNIFSYVVLSLFKLNRLKKNALEWEYLNFCVSVRIDC